MVKKLSIIGAGKIGSTVALMAAKMQNLQTVLFDIKQGLAEGKVLDIQHALSSEGVDCNIIGTSAPVDIADSDAIIITAGVPRQPWMKDRKDLIDLNKQIITSVANAVMEFAPRAFVILVTNPLDGMTLLFHRITGIARHMAVGMAGELDVSRFKFFLSQELKVSVSDIDAIILGCHGDTMVPLLSRTTVSGIGIMEFIKEGIISKQRLDEIILRTKNGGAEIISLLGDGSAFFAPARTSLSMACSYLFNTSKVFCSSTLLKGEYGVNDICIGVPVIIDGTGAKKILPLALSDDERAQLDKSIAEVNSIASLI